MELLSAMSSPRSWTTRRFPTVAWPRRGTGRLTTHPLSSPHGDLTTVKAIRPLVILICPIGPGGRPRLVPALAWRRSGTALPTPLSACEDGRHGSNTTGEGPRGSRVLRGARPERRQHPEGAGRVRHRQEPVHLRGGDVRP